jgi:hypothetical protein
MAVGMRRGCPSVLRIKGAGAAQPHPEPDWLQPQNARARGDLSRCACLTGRPKPNLALAPGSSHHHPLPPPPSATYQRLMHTIAECMLMSPIYQP